jgi:hypothetical protein
MVDISELNSTVQITSDDQGNQVVQLPLKLWEDLIAEFKQMSMEKLQAVSDDESLPQHVRLKALMQLWAFMPDDKSPEWWAEFDSI